MRRLLHTAWNVKGLGLVIGTAASIAVGVWFDIFDWLHRLDRSHPYWGLDDVFSVLMILSLLVPFVLLRVNLTLARAHHRTVEAQAETQRIAFHDPLTGLPNRRLFQRHVEEAEGRAKAGEEPAMTVLLLDLDRFKPVNDLRGHAAGDLLLCEAAKRLRRLAPEDALVARLGGDEFVLAVGGPDAEDHGATLARRVNAAMAEAFDFGDWSASMSCSVGIADWAPGMSPSDLLRHADQAMYRAKALGRGGHAHYDDALGEALRERAALEQDLRRALARGTAITPYFQPIYDITGRSLRAFEVLARWSDPVRGFVPPDHFIPVAEEIGLIDPLSELVLDRACAALAAWPTELPISFNLSPRQFGDMGLPGRILSILERHGIPGSRLEIEITERAVLADLDVARAIVWELAAAGVRISLDDFGTGMSSLAILTQLPIDSLKIDRCTISPHRRALHEHLVCLEVGSGRCIIPFHFVAANLMLPDGTDVGITHEQTDRPEGRVAARAGHVRRRERPLPPHRCFGREVVDPSDRRSRQAARPGPGGCLSGLACGGSRESPRPAQGSPRWRRPRHIPETAQFDLLGGNGDCLCPAPSHMAEREARGDMASDGGGSRQIPVRGSAYRGSDDGRRSERADAHLERAEQNRKPAQAAAGDHLRLGEGGGALPAREPGQRRQEGAADREAQQAAHGFHAVARGARLYGSAGATGHCVGADSGVPDPHGSPFQRSARVALGGVRFQDWRVDRARRAHEAGHSA
nr:EAL domain-containing protein [Rubellimicrobium mesophilum]